MQRLLAIGFKHAGSWSLDGDDLALTLDPLNDAENALYAFVVDGEVKYIGKTTKSLRGRLYHYLKPGPSQSTNIKNNTNIRSALTSGRQVDILAFTDAGDQQIGEFRINLAAGLEDSLISTLRPEWNGVSDAKRSASSRAVRKPLSTEARSQSAPFPPQGVGSLRKAKHGCPSHTQRLRPTYYKQGFFNAPKASDRYYGLDDEQIEIYCGDSPQHVSGRINRRANRSGAPRIMGGARLRDWFQEHFKINDVLLVENLSPNSIRMSELP